jgi:hypothetical protein
MLAETGESITMSSKRTWLNAGITLFNGKISLTFLFLLLALPAFASGGSCPSGANYTNPTNPQGPLVTLASLGVTSCYFVAANGSDSYDGLTEASGHPWLHAPFMPNCTGNCATVTSQSVSAWPGVGIIFRGGDTWHFGNSSATPYVGGTWEWNTGTLPEGTTSHPIYIGVDQSWYSGLSWARPIFSADNPPCNASTVGTLPDGATCTGTTDGYGQPSYYVSSCGYQISSTNNFIDESFVYGYIWDNFEMSGLCQSSTGQPAHHDEYFSYGSLQGPTTFINLYMHGASHLQFQAKNGANCTGLVCTNIFAFTGGSNSQTYGEIVANTVVDFSDSDPGGESLCFGGFWNVSYNVFRYTTNCLPNAVHLFHDNLYEYFFENGHGNLLEDIDEGTGANAFYNNVFRHVENLLTTGGGVFLWLSPPTSATTDYVFNNIGYDVGALEYLNFGGTAGNNAQGTYTYFNNTWQTDVSQPILRCNLYTNGRVNDVNNHYIDNQSYILSPCSTLTTTTSLAQTNAQADANVSMHFDQYSALETLGYSPVLSTNSTVGAGTNQYSDYCSALSTAGLSAAATACQSDTTYACTYNTSNHTVSCPAQTVARPSSGAWDVGAYEFTAQPSPNPPTGLSAVVN